MSGVLVTGASGGIGAALSRALGARGHDVALGYDHGEARAAQIGEEIRAAGGSAQIVRLPLRDCAAIETALAQFPAQSAPGTVVLCAWPRPKVLPFTRQTSEDFAVQLGALDGCRALLAAAWRLWWRKAGGGHVVGVLTSALGPPTAPHMASYVAAKGGLRSLLDAAAAELGPAGLRVSTLSPGYVETTMLESFDPRLLERARELSPRGGFLEPEEVAGVLMEMIQQPPPPGTVQERRID